MRVSDIALAAMLCAGAFADNHADGNIASTENPSGSAPTSFRSSVDFPIVSQNNGDAGDSRSQYYTNVFNMGPETHGEQEEFEGMYLIGMILGMVTTGLFMIFGVIVILRNEVKRHYEYSDDVQKAKNKLTGKQFECSVSDMNAYAKEFKDKELSRGKAVDAEEERRRLAEIN